MPPKEGERGRDQHLAVETLPPRVILCTRKMKAVGKRWLSWLRAVEAGRSVKGECGVHGPSSATLTATHTQELVFISGRDFQVMWGWRTWVGWSVDRFLGRAGQRESCAGLPCPSVSSEVAEPYPRTEYNSHGIDSSFLRWALRNFKRPFI